ncbi:RNA-directed DNA polymerase, partial [Bradyrhizobium sp. 33ap4]|uniref:RNA-directed DNA polymerase n=1 Tax=Bradyrhizobium sp. 33ap4 TaxID=3061630 RepID=UPI003977D264
ESTRFFPEVMTGFRQGRSAIDSVIDLVTTVQQAKADGQITAAVFLDVAKAYDSVLHSVVVATLEEAGVGGNTLSWIQDFLSNRSLFVRTTEGDTTSYPVSRGIPQGSVPSPLFLNVVMASLPAQLRKHTRITLYADDICISTSAVRRDTLQRRLQHALHDIVLYLADRGLSVSPSKTVAMAFTRRSFQRYPLYVAGSPLKFVTHYKYLGVTVDRGLTWSRHIRTMSDRSKVYINVLRHISGASWGPCYGDLRRVYSSLILGAIRYSLPVLYGLNSSAERELLNIQARNLRV